MPGRAGCCGFKGPGPSTTLDKKLLQTRKSINTALYNDELSMMEASKGFFAPFARADSSGFQQLENINLAVANLSSKSRFFDRIDYFLRQEVGNSDFYFYFRSQINRTVVI